MKRAMKGTILLALFWLGGCGGGGSSNPTVTVTISPTTATVVLGSTQQFTATVSPSTVNQAVTWSVNGVTGGNTALGTISTLGLYTAPSPNVTTNPVTVTVTSQADTTVSASATVTLNSGATVVVTPSSATLAAGDPAFQFTATVTGSTTTAVTWQVNDITGGNSTVGSITQTGSYTAPSMVASQTMVTVKAVLQSDTTRTGSAAVTLVPPGAATLTQVSPPTVAQGSFFEDLYLIGTKFLSNSTARVNGTTVPTSFISSNILRARVPAALLGAAVDHFVDVQQAQGQLSGTQIVKVVAATPALVSASPESGPQNSGGFNVNFDGGYYATSPPSPPLTADFNEQSRPATVSSLNSRQLSVALSSLDFSAAGLFAMRLRNSAATPSIAATNLAVVPPDTAPSVIAALTVGSQPSAVAVNTATGIAVVANRGSSSVTLIALTSPAPAICSPPPTTFPGVCVASIPVGTAPTGVAVDNLRNLAVVVNNGSNSISIINLLVSPPGVTTINSGVQASPFSVGVNPLTGQGLITYQNSSNASFLDLTSSPPTVVAPPTAVITTGQNPQVAIEPRLNWAIVTPGGSSSGTVSIVSLDRIGRTAVSTIAAPSANGAVRSSNVVTITTTAAHGLTPGEQVTISGVTDSSFNGGPFSVISVPSSTTFTYNQTAANATSGNGTVTALPLLTVIGSGFQPGAVVRLDETNLTTNVISSRKLTATVPTTMLAAPRQFALDVQNPGPDFSNVASFTVIQAVPVGTVPAAVAIDPDRDLGVVANSGSATATLVDLNSGSIVATVNVGRNPQGAAVFSRAGRAVVTNFDDGTATILDLVQRTALAPVTVGTNPLGVAIHPGTGQVVVANSGAQSLSFFDVQNPGTPTTLMVDQGPLAVAVDPTRNIAAVAHGTSNSLVIVDLATTQIKGNRVTGFQLPTGVLYDPVSDVNFSGTVSDSFLVTSSLANNIVAVHPDTGLPVSFRVGINPTSIARNYRSSTLVTVNSSSQTMSVMDFFANPTSPPIQTATVKGVLPLSGSLHFSVAVHPRTNLAVVVDPTNNRLLLVPLPR